MTGRPRHAFSSTDRDEAVALLGADDTELEAIEHERL